MRCGGTGALALLLAVCGGGDAASGASAAEIPPRTTLTYRQFSTSPSLGNGAGSRDPHSADYGALSIFIGAVEDRARTLRPAWEVAFSLAPGAPALAEVANNDYAAGYFAGGSLNPVWGFAFNSVPFGPDFVEMVDFLYEGGGVALANRLLARRGVDVVALPVVGSPAQMSGYFRKPVGTPDCPAGDVACAGFGTGIGLEGMCAEAWTLRYLPPAGNIVGLACDGFAAPRRLRFVQAIPGGGSLLTAIQRGTVDGLEFATPLDDDDATQGGFFTHAEAQAGSDGRNPGEIGLRFAHYPAWHQPFYIGWLVINRSAVWDRLDGAQRAAIEAAAREALLASHRASSSVQCEHLTRILGVNDGREQRGPGAETPGASADMVLAAWHPADLRRLRDATGRYLDSKRGGAAPTADQADYAAVLGALLRHLGHSSTEEMLAAWTRPELPVPGGCGQ